MAYDLSSYLVVGISSSALFDLSTEHKIFETKGLDEYLKYQSEHEKDILKPGPGYKLVHNLLRLNELIPNKRLVEVIIMSRNSANSSLRFFNSIEHYGLDIVRAALTSGMPIKPYFDAFNINLFLSTNGEDVQDAINANIAAGIIYNNHQNYQENKNQIRIAFDGDAVLFSDESERIYQKEGLEAFAAHEKANALKPLPEGPFARFLKSISLIQNEFPLDHAPIRTALVTARSSPAHERVIRTLQVWNVKIDEVFFLGGVRKAEVLKAFGADIYFDDQDAHLKYSVDVVPSARVPYKNIQEQISIFDDNEKK
ncbi:MAG: 5-nucleotidase [Haloplasmataceae bacterium]|nr:5-nucleotidase [Haloplasmataceae bacterium]